ncbi:hypothetical protein BaRGS_00023193 [Batillaria attramentaria]|uniref:Uncharacterized protein n=1 Tax=Batillaria attramentaria TaxID=370345 RepID=A0ABD0KEG2_9CAEN
MPIDQQSFRTVCGGFLPRFVSFMFRRAHDAAKHGDRVLTLHNRTLNVFSLAVALVITAMLQQAGDYSHVTTSW